MRILFKLQELLVTIFARVTAEWYLDSDHSTSGLLSPVKRAVRVVFGSTFCHLLTTFLKERLTTVIILEAKYAAKIYIGYLSVFVKVRKL